MNRSIQSALISVFYKDGLEPIVHKLHELGISLYSTGGTQNFIEALGIPCTSVESVTGYPSILGGRVKTLHPKVFGGILARRDNDEDRKHILGYEMPLFDLVIVDLYPFEETVKNTTDEKEIIEKIDIGGVSLIRAAGKNFADVCVIASKDQYSGLLDLLEQAHGETTLEQRKKYAADAYAICAHYDAAIAGYFRKDSSENYFQVSNDYKYPLRYGENPHQEAAFYGDIQSLFGQLNGKELSYNNIVDADAACKLIAAFDGPAFAIIKHTNVCGAAEREELIYAWEDALAGDPESAFGGVLVTNRSITTEVAEKINELFFEILIAPGFYEDALTILKSKKNRILLLQKEPVQPETAYKNVLNGILVQDADNSDFEVWNEVGERTSTGREKEDLVFANIVCKHLKSNAIAIVKNKQLIGKGCGQTSRIDAVKQALDKAAQFGFDTKNAVMASDAFFPFDDCVRKAHEAGITAVIQPGGSVRDGDSIQFCKENGIAMVLTQTRHFRH